MKKFYGLVAMIVALSGLAYGLTVNPASNVLGDSANTANTIIYRDASGQALMAAVNITSGTLRLATPSAIGIQWAIVNDAGKFQGFCVSTAATLGSVALSTSPTLACAIGAP